MFTLKNPTGKIVHVPVIPNAELLLAFEPGAGAYARFNNNLVISFADGGKLILGDFYAQQNEELPHFIIDDTPLSAEQFLAKFDDESLLPGAGPAGVQATTSGGGVGEYDDYAGNLIDGISRLEGLGNNQWTRDTGLRDGDLGLPKHISTPAVETPVEPPVDPPLPPEPPITPPVDPPLPPEPPIDPPVDPPLPPEPPIDPPVAPPTPPATLTYQARAVLYLLGDAASSMTFRVLGSDYLPIEAGANNQVSMSTAAGWPDSGYYTLSYNDATGRIAYALTAAGLAALAALPVGVGASLYEYITVTVNGQSYNMQLVANSDGNFDSAVQDAADVGNGLLDTATGHIIWGEWHSGADSLRYGSSTIYNTYNISSSNGNDELVYGNPYQPMFNKVGFSGELHTNDGNDTLSIYGAGAKNANIDMGSGDNVVTIASGSNGLNASNLRTGDGNNHIDISANNNFGIWNSTVNTGAGDDYISIKTTGMATSAYAMHNAHVDAGNGNNVLRLASAGTDAVYSSSIITGDGNDDIDIKAGSAGKLGLSSSTLDAGNGNNTINVSRGGSYQSRITAGAGDDTINIAGAVTGWSLGGSVINAGDGNNTINIAGDSTQGVWLSQILTGAGDDHISVSGGVYGLYNGNINAGNGTNQITISATSYAGRAVEGGKIITGSGDDIIHIAGTSSGMYSDGTYVSILNAGDGNNDISITGGDRGVTGTTKMLSDGTTPYTVESSVVTGAGDDTINIAGGQYGIRYSSLHAGDGSNYVHVSGGSSGIGADHATLVTGHDNDTVVLEGLYAAQSSTIDLGAGNDHLTLIGSISDLTAHGGAGLDTLHLDGMIINGSHNFNLSDLFSDSHFDGFEHIDMSGGHANIMTIDSLLSSLHMDTHLLSSGFSLTDHALQQTLITHDVLRVTGDTDAGAEDKLILSGNWNKTADATMYDGVSYDVWHDQAQDQYLMVQQHIIVSTS